MRSRHSPRITLSIIALCLGLGVSPSIATATTVVPVTIEDLARQSEDIALVRVLQRSSHWSGRLIVTDNDTEVLIPFQGTLASHNRVVIRLAGGTVGTVREVIPDAPEMVPGSTYLVFLRGGTDGVRYVSHLTAAVVQVTPRTDGTTLDARLPVGLLSPSPRLDGFIPFETIIPRLRGLSR